MSTLPVFRKGLRRVKTSLAVAMLSLTFATNVSAEDPAASRANRPELFISAGGSGNIVYNGNGEIWHWGEEYDNTSPIYPERLAPMEDISQISQYSGSNLFLTKDGTVWNQYVRSRYDWKKNRHLTPEKDTLKPSRFNVTDIVKIEAGSWFHSGIKKDGSVWVWVPMRARNVFEIPNALQIPNVSGAVDIGYTEQSWHHLLGIVQKDGSVWVWEGGTTYGGIVQVKAARVEGLTDVTKLFTGDGCFFAMKKDGSVWGWGSNLHGQLGLNEQKIYDTPQPLPFLTGISTIEGGKTYTTALKKDGTVWTWGVKLDRIPQFVGAVIHPEPKRVEGLKDVANIACGNDHCIAIQKDQSLWAWGKNDLGQLGDGTFKDSDQPIRVILDEHLPPSAVRNDH